MNWKQFFTLGLLAPGVWDGKGEPVAYLYGPDKVRLPGIYSVYTPELQKQYPFAQILPTSTGSDGNVYMFVAMNIKHYGVTGGILYGNGVFIQPETEPFSCVWSYMGRGANVWEPMSEDIDTTTHPHLTLMYPVTWSNYNIYNKTGEEVLFTASEPVPVYE